MMCRNVIHEHDRQVTKEGAGCRLACGTTGSSSLQSQVQSEEVHAASTLRQPRAEGLSQNRLAQWFHGTLKRSPNHRTVPGVVLRRSEKAAISEDAVKREGGSVLVNTLETAVARRGAPRCRSRLETGPVSRRVGAGWQDVTKRHRRMGVW